MIVGFHALPLTCHHLVNASIQSHLQGGFELTTSCCAVKCSASLLYQTIVNSYKNYSHIFPIKLCILLLNKKCNNQEDMAFKQ